MTAVRRYRPADAPAVRTLHERVIRATGTDPTDLPNADDIADVEGEFHRMRAARDCQREGVGSSLLAALKAPARERGVDRLYARTARRQAAAVAFYPANGYEQVDTETYGEYDLIVYRKDLR